MDDDATDPVTPEEVTEEELDEDGMPKKTPLVGDEGDEDEEDSSMDGEEYV